MCIKPTGMTIAIVGGDKRQCYLAKKLIQEGFDVHLFALEGLCAEPSSPIESLSTIIQDVHIIILPVPGIDKNNQVIPNKTASVIQLTEQWISTLSSKTLLMVGKGNEQLKKWCKQYNIALVEYMNDDAISILNAVPTAEAAIQIAMEHLPITIFNSKPLVFGMGRCGVTLALTLQALGAKTTVVARKASDLALGQTLGLTMVDYQQLNDILPAVDVIFNSVPALVLPEERLRLLPPTTPIIDIASSPGGVDYQWAKNLGMTAILATSLPGKYSPQTAGEILGEIIPGLINKHFSLPDFENQGGSSNES